MSSDDEVANPLRRFFAKLFNGDEGTAYLTVTGICALASLAALIIYGASQEAGTFTMALGVVVGLASFWLAGLIGFIFGLAPFSGKPGTERGPLHEISDWLTKIIVGVGLVEFRSIVGAVVDVGDFFGTQTGLEAGSELFTAYVLVEAACGFWFLYFWTVVRWEELLVAAKRRAKAAETKADFQASV